MEEPGGELGDPREAFRLAGGFAFPVRFGYGDIEATGDVVDRFHEGNVLVLHEKGKYVSALAATEAMEDLAFRIDAEGRGLLVVKGAESQVVSTRLPQGDVVGHDVHDVRLRPDRIDEVVRYPRQGSISAYAGRLRPGFSLSSHQVAGFGRHPVRVLVLPLHVAADGIGKGRPHRPSRRDIVKRVFQVICRYPVRVPGTVDPAAGIDQVAVPVEDIEVGRSEGAVGPRGILGPVAQVDPGKAMDVHAADHVVEVVVGMRNLAVGIDPDETDPPGSVLFHGASGDLVGSRHVGAMVAGEEHHQGFRAGEILQAVRPSVRRRQ